MLSNLPAYIPIAFGLITLSTLLLFYGIVRQSRVEAIRRQSTLILLGLIGWLFTQAFLTMNGVYSMAAATAGPPKLILFGILPTVLTIVLLFATPAGRRFIDSLPLTTITYLHVLRIPVELVLFWLFIHKAVPELMTFEGRNFDILSGISAPFVAYFGLTKGKLSRPLILLWNVVCLGLLLSIVRYALLSAPSPMQQFAFDQPNIAITHFPFSWLPTFVVPIVLFGHLVSIRQLIVKPSSDE
ncbi:hypothetical protein [uncultured Fibrella sp.]|uniref:hypothetical protein n=1 Tax=uncultured Fibrella sp. TaxID=1284596 RepID=UPI0035C9AD57